MPWCVRYESSRCMMHNVHDASWCTFLMQRPILFAGGSRHAGRVDGVHGGKRHNGGRRSQRFLERRRPYRRGALRRGCGHSADWGAGWVLLQWDMIQMHFKYVERIQIIFETYLRRVKNGFETYLKPIWNVYETYLRLTWDVTETLVHFEYVSYTFLIRFIYVSDMFEMLFRYV